MLVFLSAVAAAVAVAAAFVVFFGAVVVVALAVCLLVVGGWLVSGLCCLSQRAVCCFCLPLAVCCLVFLLRPLPSFMTGLVREVLFAHFLFASLGAGAGCN